MEGTVVLKCDCPHDFQDETYGKGMRVHNVNPKGLAYCTVCAPNYTHQRNSVAISPLPHIGFVGSIGRRLRIGKSVASK